MDAYPFYDLAHAALSPFRFASMASSALAPSLAFFLPAAAAPFAAFGEMGERMTRVYAKPSFDLVSTVVDGRAVDVTEELAWSSPFCRLLRFAKRAPDVLAQPRLLILAPMSGHHATLLRPTVKAFLPHFDVHVSDWTCASRIPLSAGTFGLEDYVDHVRSMLRSMGPGVHVLAVCQPSVPALAAVAVMEAEGDPASPASLAMMGGPVDTRRNPTAVNRLATERGTDWFRGNMLSTVTRPHAGAGRRVYPGFMQLASFMAMNADRHVDAFRTHFSNLMGGDLEAARKHREFYDEYLAVMDMDAGFYIETVDAVFVRHALPKGEMLHRGVKVDLSKIRRCALMAVEGEFDDITGIGQTMAALDLCRRVPDGRKAYHRQAGVGHYGVFSGRRFEAEIAPRVTAFAYGAAREAGSARSAKAA